MAILPHSETWETIEAYLDDSIASKREQLESPACTESTANILRGWIMACKDLKELAGEGTQSVN